MTHYQPQGFALTIFQQRYAIHPGETWDEACKRVAAAVAVAELGEAGPKYRAIFSEFLKTNSFMPGGRIWYGAGRPKAQLLNCFVTPTLDSREGWGRAVSDMIVIVGTGGGMGANCSAIRPRGTPINGTGGVATGAVSLMEIMNAAGEVMRAGGGRRTALGLGLSITHGDIQEFLDKKLDLKQLNNANISVVFDQDPEDFFRKVKKDEIIELAFRGKKVATVSAKILWSKIVSNAIQSGEPGILNGFLANKMSNTWYCEQLTYTNPCGELWLPSYGCCDLGSLVLPRFVAGKELDEAALKQAVQLAVRFLDDVLTVNNYPLPEIKQTASDTRRIGLGVMGLHDMLLLMNLKYNSDSGLEAVDRVMKLIKNAAYEASIELAQEKGAFPKFDPDQFGKSGFIKTLKPSLRSKIQQFGIRNCALLTIAPTGTTSMVCDVTGGIEPMIASAYVRKWQGEEKLQSEVVVHPLFRQFVTEGRSIKHFQEALDLSVKDHFEMQRVCQRHLDNACSKTINIPASGVSEQQLSDAFMEFFPELKGVTVYRDGSRGEQPLTPLSPDEALKHVGKGSAGPAALDPCKSGSCDL